MELDIVGDLDAPFSSCMNCHSENTNTLSHIIHRELQSGLISQESAVIIHSRSRSMADTTVLNVGQRFILLLQKRRRGVNVELHRPSEDESLERSSPSNLGVIDLLESKFTEFWCSPETRFEHYGIQLSELKQIIRFERSKIWQINDHLLVFAFSRKVGLENLYRSFLCPILLDSANESFHFLDLIMLQEQPVEWCGDGKLSISRCGEDFRLHATFYTKQNGDLITKKFLNFEIQNDRFIFVDKTSIPIPNYKRKKNCYVADAFNGKRYEFKRFWKRDEQPGRRIPATNYSLVRVYDLEQPEEGKPQIQHTQCQYDDLRGVLDGHAGLKLWHSSGFFVSIVSQSAHYSHIYSFNVDLLQWRQIEWLKFPLNHHKRFHTRLIDYDSFDACVSTTILHVVSPNTLFLIKQYRIKDTNGQSVSHRNYYRLTVGRPDYLRDLARVRNSVYKNHLRNAPFNKFECVLY